jgi:hypothetical protein
MHLLPTLGYLALADRADDFDAQGYAVHVSRQWRLGRAFEVHLEPITFFVRVIPIPATLAVPRNSSTALCFAARACCRVHAFMMSPGSFEKLALDFAAL